MDKTTLDIILDPGNAKTHHKRESQIKDKFFAVLKKAANQIPFMEDLIAAYFCAFDPQTPARVRGILLAALAYFVMPFDVVPDMLALIGFSDDIAVLTIAIASVRTYINDTHLTAAREMLDQTKDNEIL